MRANDIITVRRIISAERAGSWSHASYLDVDEGKELRITRVYADRVIARGAFTIYGQTTEASVYIARDHILTLNGRPFDDTTGLGEVRRPLGQKPDDTEDMKYIGVDDPRIQWLFDDMGQFATNKHWCGEYDVLCVRLGIPGRPREFTVQTTFRGMTMATTVSARSQAEANKIVADALSQTGTE